MDGKKVFKLASTYMPDFMNNLLKDAGKSIQDIDWFVPHQASQLALHHLTKRLEVNPDKVINILLIMEIRLLHLYPRLWT
jgi:3-oxoacyl-[acyl-carrier-protein] synthase-3